MPNRARRIAAAVFLVLALAASACSKAPEADVPKQLPKNVSSKPETLLPAPTGQTDDTPDWTALPAPVAAVFADGLVKGKFQAFAAMKQTTVQVQLKAAPAERDVYRALAAVAPFAPGDYTLQLNTYAPGPDGKPRFKAWVWDPMGGTLVRKSSTDADQSWDAAITAVTEGSTTSITPDIVVQVGKGQAQPPVF